MIDRLQLNFSHSFNGVVWNLVAAENEPILVVEVRNLEEKQVKFSALNYRENTFLWTHRSLEESWWITANLAKDGVILFTIYLDTNNPDKKGVLAYNLENLELMWWNNDFSVSNANHSGVTGFTSKFGLKQITLDLTTGKELMDLPMQVSPKRTGLRKPVQYPEETQYFETVKTFLANQLNLEAVSALEYLETDNNIIISCYTRNEVDNDLANFLLVLSREGEVLLKEPISPKVKGVGLDTFFILDGSLLFVKNKSELVSYTIL